MTDFWLEKIQDHKNVLKVLQEFGKSHLGFQADGRVVVRVRLTESSLLSAMGPLLALSNLIACEVQRIILRTATSVAWTSCVPSLVANIFFLLLVDRCFILDFPGVHRTPGTIHFSCTHWNQHTFSYTLIFLQFQRSFHRVLQNVIRVTTFTLDNI